MGLNDTFINYDTYIYHTLGLIFNLSVTLISYYVLIMKKYILKNLKRHTYIYIYILHHITYHIITHHIAHQSRSNIVNKCSV